MPAMFCQTKYIEQVTNRAMDSALLSTMLLLTVLFILGVITHPKVYKWLIGGYEKPKRTLYRGIENYPVKAYKN